jgi:hypothetical protein
MLTFSVVYVATSVVFFHKVGRALALADEIFNPISSFYTGTEPEVLMGMGQCPKKKFGRSQVS